MVIPGQVSYSIAKGPVTSNITVSTSTLHHLVARFFQRIILRVSSPNHVFFLLFRSVTLGIHSSAAANRRSLNLCHESSMLSPDKHMSQGIALRRSRNCSKSALLKSYTTLFSADDWSLASFNTKSTAAWSAPGRPSTTCTQEILSGSLVSSRSSVCVYPLSVQRQAAVGRSLG